MKPTKAPTQIHPETSLAHIELLVKDLGNMVAFYSRLLGFQVLDNSNGQAHLSASGDAPAQVTLSERPGARPQEAQFVGLYHIAFRYTGRQPLATALLRLVAARWPLQGASDHGVSEAIYLADPEGNGIELYRDRPRDQWPRLQDSIQMGNLPLDLHKLLEEADKASAQTSAIDPGTDLGHIHLQVSDLAKARSFYHDLLGLDVIMALPTALFMSTGGYHHHLGANTWQSLNAPRRGTDVLGLASYAFLIPDEGSWLSAIQRIHPETNGRRAVQRNGHAGLAFYDQDGITVELLTGKSETERKTLSH
ncbi:MAG: VOC family protein [Anaerolineales bacterium]